MNTIQSVVLVGHTLIAMLIIVLVLLQRGKGAEAGAAFGSGASGTVFGARGSSNFFSRATAVLATVFFATSLALAYISSQHSTAPASLLEGAPAIETPPVPEVTGSDDSSDIGGLPELPNLGDAQPVTGDSEMPALDLDEPAEDRSEP